MSESDHCTAVFSEAALEQLDSLYGYAMTLTHNSLDAEDLVQETYLRAVRAFGQLIPNSNLKGWLFVIMRNAWLNQMRHAQSGPRFVEFEKDQEQFDQWQDERAEDPYAIYLRKLEREEISAAIDGLPSLYREVIVLRDLEGFTYHEISSLLGCPAGTVMSRLGRARQKLRRLLAGWGSQETVKAG
ncbi:MAG TPA: sigma-70 family RNA polymerase sigma factor [Pyrinomonadaceae bacterium]